MKYIVYTDGGCAFNPGGPGGCGVVIINENNKVIELMDAYKATTNNRMEITAPTMALEYIKRHDNNAEKITLYSDSQYFVNTANGTWHGDKNPDLWKKYKELAKEFNIEYKWVRGHNGNQYNERCDELATEAMQTLPKKTDKGYKK